MHVYSRLLNSVDCVVSACEVNIASESFGDLRLWWRGTTTENGVGRGKYIIIIKIIHSLIVVLNSTGNTLSLSPASFTATTTGNSSDDSFHSWWWLDWYSLGICVLLRSTIITWYHRATPDGAKGAPQEMFTLVPTISVMVSWLEKEG